MDIFMECSGKVLDIPYKLCYNALAFKEIYLTGGVLMDALEMALLFDYYGGMLTEKQRQCYIMRYEQDLSLSEIGDALGVSRQAVCDNLTRTEALLRKMERNIGCVSRSLSTRKAVQVIVSTAEKLSADPATAELAQQLLAAAKDLEE